MEIIHISHGGPTHKIKVGDKIYGFEDHPYCGPSALNRRGDPLTHQPMTFLRAATYWYQHGKRLTKDGFCVYEVPARFG